MPQSKSRNLHPHHQQNHPAPPHAKPKQSGRAALVAMVLFALLGLGISYFIAGYSKPSLAAGVLIGAIGGYLVGHQMDKSLKKK